MCSGPEIGTTLLNTFWKTIACRKAWSYETGKFANFCSNCLYRSNESPSMQRYNDFPSHPSLSCQIFTSSEWPTACSTPDSQSVSMRAIPYPSVFISSRNETGGIIIAVALMDSGFHSWTTLSWNLVIEWKSASSPCNLLFNKYLVSFIDCRLHLPYLKCILCFVISRQ